MSLFSTQILERRSCSTFLQACWLALIIAVTQRLAVEGDVSLSLRASTELGAAYHSERQSVLFDPVINVIMEGFNLLQLRGPSGIMVSWTLKAGSAVWLAVKAAGWVHSTHRRREPLLGPLFRSVTPICTWDSLLPKYYYNLRIIIKLWQPSCKAWSMWLLWTQKSPQAPTLVFETGGLLKLWQHRCSTA